MSETNSVWDGVQECGFFGNNSLVALFVKCVPATPFQTPKLIPVKSMGWIFFLFYSDFQGELDEVLKSLSLPLLTSLPRGAKIYVPHV